VYIYNHYYNVGKEKLYDSGTVLIVGFSVTTGLVNMLSLNPNIRAINEAKVIGKTIFDVVDRNPRIADVPNAVDSFSVNKGIFFKDVMF
jgi:hypothetical protein